MAEVNATISKALVPISPIRDHQAQQRRDQRNADHAYTPRGAASDRVAISQQAFVAPSPPSPRGYEAVPLKDSPQTREQVRAHYGHEQTAAAADRLTPPGSMLNITV